MTYLKVTCRQNGNVGIFHLSDDYYYFKRIYLSMKSDLKQKGYERFLEEELIPATIFSNFAHFFTDVITEHEAFAEML